jgi:hypothetical protein
MKYMYVCVAVVMLLASLPLSHQKRLQEKVDELSLSKVRLEERLTHENESREEREKNHRWV